MIRLIPPARPEELEHGSERDTLEALLKLPAPWVAMHSLPWLRPERDRPGAPLREGEADFVLLHPDLGMLVVEVKGGALELQGRAWTRGGKPIKDPLVQARRSRWALLHAVAERLGWPEVAHDITHGDVVITPHHRWQGALPLHADQRLLIDADGLPELEMRLRRALAAFGSTRMIPTERWRALLDALAPSLRLIRCDARALDAEGARIAQLTEAQQGALLGLLASPAALVEGGAGTGKTLLALAFAEQLAQEGARCLFVCYNRALARWVRERLADAAGQIDVDTFHGLTLRLARAASIDVNPEAGGPGEDFWRDEAPLLLEQAALVLEGAPAAPRYDVLLIDEAQDFDRAWLEALAAVCPSGRRYLFADLRQRLRPGPAPALAQALTLRIDTNCRNTRSIAGPAAELAGLSMRPLALAPAGEPPTHIQVTHGAAVAGELARAAEGLLGSGMLPQQVVILGLTSLGRGPLADVGAAGGSPFTESVEAWRRGEGVLVTTPRAFKGLESDAVILACPTRWGELFTPTDLYVGWTRARLRLTVVTPPGEPRARVEEVLRGSLRHTHPTGT